MPLSGSDDGGSSNPTNSSSDEATVKDNASDVLSAFLKAVKCNGGRTNRTDLWEGYFEGHPRKNDGYVHPAAVLAGCYSCLTALHVPLLKIRGLWLVF